MFRFLGVLDKDVRKQIDKSKALMGENKMTAAMAVMPTEHRIRTNEVPVESEGLTGKKALEAAVNAFMQSEYAVGEVKLVEETAKESSYVAIGAHGAVIGVRARKVKSGLYEIMADGDDTQIALVEERNESVFPYMGGIDAVAAYIGFPTASANFYARDVSRSIAHDESTGHVTATKGKDTFVVATSLENLALPEKTNVRVYKVTPTRYMNEVK